MPQIFASRSHIFVLSESENFYRIVSLTLPPLDLCSHSDASFEETESKAYFDMANTEPGLESWQLGFPQRFHPLWTVLP